MIYPNRLNGRLAMSVFLVKTFGRCLVVVVFFWELGWGFSSRFTGYNPKKSKGSLQSDVG